MVSFDDKYLNKYVSLQFLNFSFQGSNIPLYQSMIPKSRQSNNTNPFDNLSVPPVPQEPPPPIPPLPQIPSNPFDRPPIPLPITYEQNSAITWEQNIETIKSNRYELKR